MNITEESGSISKLYEEYDQDDDGRLTKSDFLRFYQTKCVDNPYIVWQNLERHNVGKDLMPDQGDSNDAPYLGDPLVVRKQNDLPRHFVSASSALFDSLFQLEPLLQDTAPKHVQDSMEAVWRLVGKLKTSPSLFLSLMKNEKLEERLGRPSELSPYRLLYNLQIINSLMANYRDTEQSTATLFYEGRRNQPLWGNNAQGAGGQSNVYEREFPAFEENKTNADMDENVRGLGFKSSTNRRGGKQPDIVYDEADEWPQGGAAGDTGSGVAPSLKNQEGWDQVVNSNKNGGVQFANNVVNGNGANLSHSKRQIQNWQGQIVTENLQISQISDEELLEMLRYSILTQEEEEVEDMELLISTRQEQLDSVGETLTNLKKQWLFDFLSKGGFGHLLEIIKTIVAKYRDTESRAEILAHKAEVSSLRLTAYLIKVILIACFCSQTKDSNLAGNLQRKMSMREDDNSLSHTDSLSKPDDKP